MSIVSRSKEGGASGESLTQETYERIRHEVLSGVIRPQAKLKIREMCDRLQASQGAIREALARLTSEGLVIAEPQRGFRACGISAAELKDLTTARIEIEGWCLRRAIEVGTVSWERDLVANYYELSRTPERAQEQGGVRMHDAWSVVHMDFHDALVAACDNAWMLRMRMQLFTQAERYRRLSIPLQATRRDTNAEHLRMMEAVLKRDTKRAMEYLAEHFETTTKILLDSLKLELGERTERALAPRVSQSPKKRAEASELATRLVRNPRRGGAT